MNGLLIHKAEGKQVELFINTILKPKAFIMNNVKQSGTIHLLEKMHDKYYVPLWPWVIICVSGTASVSDHKICCSCVKPSLHELFFLCIFLIAFVMTNWETCFRLNFFWFIFAPHLAFSFKVEVSGWTKLIMSNLWHYTSAVPHVNTEAVILNKSVTLTCWVSHKKRMDRKK